MNLIFVVGFLMSVCTGGVVVLFGFILKDHFETAMSFITRQPLNDSLIKASEKAMFLMIIEKIGLLVIIIGFGIMLSGLLPILMGRMR